MPRAGDTILAAPEARNEEPIERAALIPRNQHTGVGADEPFRGDGLGETGHFVGADRIGHDVVAGGEPTGLLLAFAGFQRADAIDQYAAGIEPP